MPWPQDSRTEWEGTFENAKEVLLKAEKRYSISGQIPRAEEAHHKLYLTCNFFCEPISVWLPPVSVGMD